MKNLKIITLFAALILIILAAGCKKDEVSPDENNTLYVYEAKIIEVPDAMAQSSAAGAQETKNYILMVNSMSVYGAMLTPPEKSISNTNTKDSGTETYSWDVNDESSNYTVTLNVTESETMVSWECIISGTMGDLIFNNFIYITAEEYKDGSSSRFTLFDFETSEINMDLSSKKQGDDIIGFTLEIPERGMILINVNNDESGSLEYKDWVNNQYLLTFASSWDASGHGEFWEYEDAVIVEHGFW